MIDQKRFLSYFDNQLRILSDFETLGTQHDIVFKGLLVLIPRHGKFLYKDLPQALGLTADSGI